MTCARSATGFHGFLHWVFPKSHKLDDPSVEDFSEQRDFNLFRCDFIF